MRLLSSFASIALAVSLAACSKSSTSAGDGGLDAAALPDARIGDRDATTSVRDAAPSRTDAHVDAAATAIADQACPAPFENLPDCGIGTGVLLRASELGADVRFRAAGGDVLLAERGPAGAAQPIVVQVRVPEDFSSDPPVLTTVMDIDYAPNANPVEIRAVSGGRSSGGAFDADVFALACNADVGCTLLGGNSRQDAALTPLPDGVGALGDPSPVGIGASGHSICVFGAGLRCHDGTQVVQHVADDPSRLLRAMSGYGPYRIVVGDGGRALIDEGEGYSEVDGLGAHDLSSASIMDVRLPVYVGFDSGFFQRDEGEWTSCDGFAPAHLAGDIIPRGTFANTSGQVAQRRRDRSDDSLGYCALSDLGEALLGGSSLSCGLSLNPFVISESTLWVLGDTKLQCIID